MNSILLLCGSKKFIQDFWFHSFGCRLPRKQAYYGTMPAAATPGNIAQLRHGSEPEPARLWALDSDFGEILHVAGTHRGPWKHSVVLPISVHSNAWLMGVQTPKCRPDCVRPMSSLWLMLLRWLSLSLYCL